MDLEHDGKIHWHEFIAATLSKCEYDERNLKLAFDRLDFDHQGFITYDNLLDIVGSDSTAEDVRAMFDEVDYKHEGKIYFPEFVQIMKQNNNGEGGSSNSGGSSTGKNNGGARRGSVAARISGNQLDLMQPKDKHAIRNEMHMKIHDHVQKNSSPAIKEEGAGEGA